MSEDIKRKTRRTYQAEIFISREELSESIHTEGELEWVLNEFTKDNGLGLCYTETKFIYKGKTEKGAIITLSSLPTDEIPQPVLRQKTIELAEILLELFKQQKATIVCSDETFLVEDGVEF